MRERRAPGAITTLRWACFTGSQGAPSLCEGRLPLLLNLCTPDGKRLASTPDWPHFLAREWPRHRPTVARKFPGHGWR